jgi:hypothetical protein
VKEPDGWLQVVVRELQPLRDGCVERAQMYKYYFKSIRHWKTTTFGLQIWETNGNSTCYPWNMIEQYYVKVNSQEYVDWYQLTNGEPPVSLFKEE